jgi:hypothetical protein
MLLAKRRLGETYGLLCETARWPDPTGRAPGQTGCAPWDGASSLMGDLFNPLRRRTCAQVQAGSIPARTGPSGARAGSSTTQAREICASRREHSFGERAQARHRSRSQPDIPRAGQSTIAGVCWREHDAGGTNSTVSGGLSHEFSWPSGEFRRHLSARGDLMNCSAC